MYKSKGKNLDGFKNKSNTKSSSSEKASNFLYYHTGNVTSYNSGLNGFVPIDLDPEASNIDPVYRAILKKFDKKDITTKQKSLLELIEKVQSDTESPDSEEALLSAVQYWPRIFARLVFDEDKRVRELSQKAMAVISKRLGKKLAPYLKLILPHWIVGSIDSQWPVANCARDAINSTFIGQKRSEAYRYCCKELLDFFEIKIEICKRFYGRMEKNSKSDVSQVNYSLALVIKFMDAVLPDLIQLSHDNPEYQRLLNFINSKSEIWKLIKNVSPSVEFFDHACSLCSTFCQIIPDEFINSDKKIIQILASIFIESIGASLEFQPSQPVSICFNTLKHWNTVLEIFGRFNIDKIFPKKSFILTKILPQIRQAFNLCISDLDVISCNIPTLLTYIPVRTSNIDDFFSDRSEAAEYQRLISEILTVTLPLALKKTFDLFSSNTEIESLDSSFLNTQTTQISANVSFGDENKLILGALDSVKFIYETFISDKNDTYLENLSLLMFENILFILIDATFSKDPNKRPSIFQKNAVLTIQQKFSDLLLVSKDLTPNLHLKMKLLLENHIFESSSLSTTSFNFQNSINLISILTETGKNFDVSKVYLNNLVEQLMKMITLSSSLEQHQKTYNLILYVFTMNGGYGTKIEEDSSNNIVQTFFKLFSSKNLLIYDSLPNKTVVGFFILWRSELAPDISSQEKVQVVIRFLRSGFFKSIFRWVDKEKGEIHESFVKKISEWIQQAFEFCGFEISQYLLHTVLQTIFSVRPSDNLLLKVQLPILKNSIELVGLSLGITILQLCHSRSPNLISLLDEKNKNKLISMCIDCYVNGTIVEPISITDDLLEILNQEKQDFSKIFFNGQELLERASQIIQNFVNKNLFLDLYWPKFIESFSKHIPEAFHDRLIFTRFLYFELDEKNQRELTNILQEKWFDLLLDSITNIARSLDSNCEMIPHLPRCLTSGTPFVNIQLERSFISCVRLLLTGTSLRLAICLDYKDKLVFIIAVIRAWINSASKDQILAIVSSLKPPEIAFLGNSVATEILENFNEFWWQITSEIALETVEDKYLGSSNSLDSAWLATVLVRLNHTHPSEWNLEYMAHTQCLQADWLHMKERDFNLLISSIIPASIQWRFQSKSQVVKYLNDALSDTEIINLEAVERILKLIVTFGAIRSTAPTYLGANLHLVLSDTPLNRAIKDFCNYEDLMDFKVHPLENWIVILTLFSLESALLLWQPWQWLMNVSKDNSSSGSQVGLVQLSFRLRQFRPKFSNKEWDTVLCLISSWLSLTLDLLDSEAPEEAAPTAVADRLFRMIAAMGALFLEPASSRSLWLDSLMINTVTTKKQPSMDFLRLMSSSSDDSTSFADFCEEDDDQDDGGSSLASSAEDQDLAEFDDENSKGLENNLDYIEEDSDDAGSDIDDDNQADEHEVLDALKPGYLPKRIRPPAKIRQDWSDYFSSFIYSSMLPILIKSYFPLCQQQPQALKVSPSYLASLCAAFATCPVSVFVECVAEKASLVSEHLLQIWGPISARQNEGIKFFPSSLTKNIKPIPTKFQMSLDLSLKLMAYSAFQPGQLLGHILLTKMFRSISQKGRRISDLVYQRMPNSFISILSGSFEGPFENLFYSEHSISNWGAIFLDLEADFGEQNLPEFHRSILGYLLAWDTFFTLLTSAKPSNRAWLLNMLLTGSASYCFDRFMLVIGQFLPASSLIGSYLVRPCPLDIDSRLMIQSPSRTKAYLITSGIISNQSIKYKRRLKIKRLQNSGTCKDIVWEDIFNCIDPLVQLPRSRSSSELSHFSVHLLRRLLFEFPALIRDWYTNLGSLDKQSVCCECPFYERPGLGKQLAYQFDKIITRHFANFVGRLSITQVQQMALKQPDISSPPPSGNLLSSIANMVGFQSLEGLISVKTRLKTLEILTTYYVGDDHSLEMIIHLPERYPLQTMSLETGKRIGLSCEQWRGWLNQLSLFLNHQNGCILEGIKLWHRNIRKKFEGIEECAICYSIVNNKNFTLPKMQCRVCNKYFHHSCMYRWFSSSRNPTCPMCRNLFFANNFAPNNS